MRTFVLFNIALVVWGLQPALAQRLMTARPKHPVICYQGLQNRPDHVGLSVKAREGRMTVGGRVKTATVDVEYVNFPSDNLAKAAVQYAIEIWESQLTSSVPIRIIAEWKPLDAGVLGQALWGRAYANFGGEQHQNTFYPVALAEKISGRQLNDVLEADIVASFNSSAAWYFGTDGNTPAGKMDLVTIVLHEIAHGLGFTDTFAVEDGVGSVGLMSGGISVPFIFDVFVENQAGENLLHSFQSPSTTLKDALQSTNVFFNSPLAVDALSGTRPELFAPSPFDGGSSISHLDETVFSGSGDANRLMTPHIAFAESIHDPGTVLTAMLGDMGWIYTRIEHERLKDTEVKDGQPYPLTASISSDNGYDAQNVTLHYTTDGVNYTEVAMTPTGAADEFQAALPGTTVNMAYAYFISVTDVAGRTFTSPGTIQEPGSQPQQGTYFFNIGPDLADPQITHEPVTYVFETEDALALTAEVTDNLGVSQVVVEYFFNDGNVQSQVMNKVMGTDEFSAVISLPALQVGDKIAYRLVARDMAAAENISFHPAAGHHLVAVNGILPAQDFYSNDFDAPSGDFFGNSFSIATPPGFINGAIHSDHPYSNGTGLNEESNYIFQLQIPIRVAAANATIRFDEIVLVEPGEDGSTFGDPGFFDYVVVEGSVDNGKSWKPFFPGYDSRDKDVWLDRYNADVSGDDSQSQGDPGLFRSRVIDMLQNASFSAGDEVLIRFRLFADALAHGWGWAIDNLSIQGPVTAVEEPAARALKVYPVPATDEMQVELLAGSAGGIALRIYTVQGAILYAAEREPGPGPVFRDRVDLRGFPAGLYVLEVQSRNQFYRRKFVKE